MDSGSRKKKQCRLCCVVCEYDVFHHAIKARGHNLQWGASRASMIFAMIVYFCKSWLKKKCANYYLLHNTSNKGEGEVAKMTKINKFMPNMQYMFRPIFVSSFSMAGLFLCVIGPIGWFWRFPKTDIFLLYFVVL